MATYFSVSVVEIPTAVYQATNLDNSIVFYDSNGAPVYYDDTLTLHYNSKDALTVLQSWMTPDVTVETVVETLSVLQFLQLFTQSERIAIRTAGASNAIVDDFLYMLDHTTQVVLTDNLTIEALAGLVQAGLLTQSRANTILGV